MHIIGDFSTPKLPMRPAKGVHLEIGKAVLAQAWREGLVIPVNKIGMALARTDRFDSPLHTFVRIDAITYRIEIHPGRFVVAQYYGWPKVGLDDIIRGPAAHKWAQIDESSRETLRVAFQSWHGDPTVGIPISSDIVQEDRVLAKVETFRIGIVTFRIVIDSAKGAMCWDFALDVIPLRV
jgi:hypothetical protein